MCISLRLVGRPVCEGADAGILFVHKVDKILVAVVKARGKRLVLDDAVKLD
jgi:hypothetical protein